MKNYMRNPIIVLAIAACVYASSFAHAQPIEPPKPSPGVQTAFQVGTQIDDVMSNSGLPNPYGLTGTDYISSSGSSSPSGDTGHLETIEISAPAYAAIQFAAAATYFEREEYTKGKNCLKTAKWVLSDKDRAFTVQGGDLNALKSTTGSMPPVDPGVLESLDTILKKLADPTTFFSTDSLSSLMSDLGDLKVALDKTIKDAKDAYINNKYAEAVTTLAENGPQALADGINSMIANPVGGVLNAMTTFGSMATYLATDESPNADTCADPVLVYSGEFRIEETDLTATSVGIDFVFKRIYRNQWERDSVVGYNWTHNYDQRLITGEGENGNILFKDESGQVYAFKPDADGGFTAPYQVLAKLTKAENGYELAYADGTQKRFDVGGFLTSIADRHGNEMRFIYHTFGKQRVLRKIKDTQDREYILNYAEGRLSTIKDPFGRVIRYSHNALGDLISVRSPTTSRYPTGRITRYNYSGGYTDPALNHNITMIMDPKGQVYLKNRYGSEGLEKDRVTGQRFGGEDTPEMTFRYENIANAGGVNDVASRTTFTDRLGVAHTYAHDARGMRLSGEGHTYRYNDDGMRVKEVTPGGLTRSYRYDAGSNDPMKRQNLLAKITKAPDGLRMEERFTYGPYNQLKSQRFIAGNKVRSITNEFDTHGNIASTRRGDEITRFVRNASGQLVRTIQNGVTREITYDGANPAVITEAGGKLKRTTTLAYSGPGFFEGMIDPLNHTTRYWTDALGLPVKKRDALGTVSDYVYDENNNLVAMSLENKGGSNVEDIGYRLRREISYNVYDRPVLKRFAVDANHWEEQRYEYDAEERLIAVTNPDGVRHEYTRNDKGLITAYRRNGKLQYARRYDKDDRLIYEKDGLGHQRWWVRDGMGRVVRHVMKDGTQTLFEYTPFGEVARMRAYEQAEGMYALLKETRFTYDDRGRPIKEYERALGSPNGGWYEVERSYANGHLVALENPDGDVKRYAYDDLGRLTKTAFENGNELRVVYDLMDRVVKRSVSNSEHRLEEEYSYDALGHRISIKRGKSVATFAYDSAGKVISTTDPSGITTAYEYDGLGRILDETRDRRTRKLEWNAKGFLAKLTDGDGQVTAFEYDGDGRLAHRVNADGVEEMYSYDALGRRISAKIGTSLYSYSYDPTGKLSSRSSAGFEQRFDYDGLGRLISTHDSNDPSNMQDDVAVTFTYQGLNKLASETIDGRTVKHAYDNYGNDARITYPSGAVAKREFNALGTIRGVSMGGKRIADYDYAMFGRLSGERMGNGIERTIAYNASMLIEREHLSSTKDTLYEKSYDYDALGRLTRTQDPRAQRATTYGYDPYSQLIDVAAVEGGTSKDLAEYTLTAEGDWKAPNIAIGPGHRYVRFGDAHLAYDDRGNLIRDGRREYLYDPWNRVVAVKEGDRLLATYAYDANNRRISKTVGESATTYSYDNWNVIEEYVGKLRTKRYVQSNNLDQPAALIVDGRTYYYHRNRLGNIVALTDEDGKLIERYDYDPYGDLAITGPDGGRRATSAVGNPVTYTGQIYDEETGLYYYRNRYYSPRLGRFLTKDPTGMVDGPNLYAYVNNDPANWIDPLGTEKCAALSNDPVLSFLNGVGNWAVETTAWAAHKTGEGLYWAGEQAWNAGVYAGGKIQEGAWNALVWSSNAAQYGSGMIDALNPGMAFLFQSIDASYTQGEYYDAGYYFAKPTGDLVNGFLLALGGELQATSGFVACGTVVGCSWGSSQMGFGVNNYVAGSTLAGQGLRNIINDILGNPREETYYNPMHELIVANSPEENATNNIILYELIDLGSSLLGPPGFAKVRPDAGTVVAESTNITKNNEIGDIRQLLKSQVDEAIDGVASATEYTNSVSRFTEMTESELMELYAEMNAQGIDYKTLLYDAVEKYGLTLDEAHALFGSTNNFYYRDLKRAGVGDEAALELKNLMSDGLDKMEPSASTQYRGWRSDDPIKIEAFDAEFKKGEIVTTKDFWWTAPKKADSYSGERNMIIHTDQAKDISDLSFGVNFHDKVGKPTYSSEAVIPPGVQFEVDIDATGNIILTQVGL